MAPSPKYPTIAHSGLHSTIAASGTRRQHWIEAEILADRLAHAQDGVRAQREGGLNLLAGGRSNCGLHGRNSLAKPILLTKQ